MAKWLRQSTASQEIVIGRMVDATDGSTAETGLTIANTDIDIWKNGATTLTDKNSGGATHIATGIYSAVLDATDTNTLGNLKIFVQVAGALPWEDSYVVLPANVYDSLVLGTDTLDVQVAGMNADTVTATAIQDDAITAAKIANGAIDANTFAAGAITAAAIATDAIDNDAIAANAVVEIQSGLATAAALATVDDFLDTEVAAIKAVTDKLDTALELDGSVYRYTTNALEQGAGGGGGSNALILRDSLAQGGGASAITLDAGASATNDLYTYNIIAINGGVGEGQSRQIVGYNGTTKVATVFPPWTVTPDDTSEFVIGGFGVNAATLDNIEDEIWDALRADHVVAGSFGEYMLADVVKISDDSTAANNLESMLDGTGYTLTGVTLPWNPSWDAEVQSEVQDAIELNHLDHLLAVPYNPASKPGDSASLWNTLLENDGGFPRFTTNSLEQAPTGGGPADGSSFTNIPWNAAWDAEVQSEVQDGLSAYSAPTTSYIDGRTLASTDYATAASAAAIEADTQDLQARVPATLDGGRMRVKVEAVVDKVLASGGSGGFSIGAS